MDFVGVGQTTAAQRLDIIKKQQATSMWQSAEWGMRAIQSSFPCLNDEFPFKTRGKWRNSMKMTILVYNLCACLVGINQIRNFFLPALNTEAGAYMQ
jgi:hypothetical protein